MRNNKDCKRILKLRANKFNNSEYRQSPRKMQTTEHTEEEMENFNKFIMGGVELVTRKYPQGKVQAQMASLVNFIKLLKKS